MKNGKARKSRKHRAQKKAPRGPQGKRFTKEQKAEALELCASGLTREKVALRIGTTPESLRRWIKDAEHRAGVDRVTPPSGNGVALSAQEIESVSADEAPVALRSQNGLAPVEVDAIVELKKKHPSMGPAQIRAQLKRFRGWRLSVKAIARVLRKHGYRLVRTASRPEGDEHPTRFEAPRRCAIWQLDFCEVRVGAERRFLLIVVDDWSRYVVGHTLCESPSSEVVVETMRRAIALHGKCESVYTDRGGAFLAWRDQSGFQRFCEEELIDHHVSHAYRPQGRGKVEALIKTIQRELWEVEHFDSVAQAERRLVEWIEHYNERRAHMGIDGLCPADRFFGRAERVRAEIEARIRQRAAAPGTNPADGPVEENGAGAPVDVLRIAIVDGVAELRVFGARIPLGTVAA
jgi:transposase InsO family protein/transposase-like protein